MSDRSARYRAWLAHGNYRPNCALMTVAYATIGATLVLQPHRYDSTPSYAVLLDIAPPAMWGAVYLVVALGLTLTLAWPHVRPLAVTAFTAAIALTAAWLCAFVVRYASDHATTIVNVVSWSVFLVLLARSAFLLDDSAVRRRTPR